jgi:hypothetical protein
MSLFDKAADDRDMETGNFHHTSTRTLNAAARNASRTLLYKMAYINLNDDLKAESKHKPAAQREEQRDGESLRTDTSMAAGHTKEGLVVSDSQILKNKGDPAKFQKDATILKFPCGNQQFDAKKYTILQLSKENSHKLLLLASALEKVDTSKKMSDCKLQKCFFDSAKQLNLKEYNKTQILACVIASSSHSTINW